MRTKKGSKTRKTIHHKTKVKHKTRSRSRPRPLPRVIPETSTTVSTTLSSVKLCEEVEVGDLGGFGSTQELEAHERRCGQEATEYCHSCSRNLCSSHYELLHRDHDTTSGHNAGQSLASNP